MGRPSPDGPAGSAPAESWRPEHRLRRRPEYLRCYRRGRRFDARGLSLYVAPGEGEGPRFGITASRKVGKAAVRQRTRRRVREILRRWPERATLAPMDIVVHLHPGVAALDFEELRGALLGALATVRSGSSSRSRRPGRRGTRPARVRRSGGGQ